MTDRVSRLRQLVLQRGSLAGLTVLSTAEVARLVEEHPGVPDDYLALLQHLGWGNLAGFMIYSGPIPPQEIFGETLSSEVPPMLLVGDDFAGTHACYLTAEVPWSFAEFDHQDPQHPLQDEGVGLVEFLEAWLA